MQEEGVGGKVLIVCWGNSGKILKISSQFNMFLSCSFCFFTPFVKPGRLLFGVPLTPSHRSNTDLHPAQLSLHSLWNDGPVEMLLAFRALLPLERWLCLGNRGNVRSMQIHMETLPEDQSKPRHTGSSGLEKSASPLSPNALNSNFPTQTSLAF